MKELSNKIKRDIVKEITIFFRLRKNLPSELIYHILFGMTQLKPIASLSEKMLHRKYLLLPQCFYDPNKFILKN